MTLSQGARPQQEHRPHHFVGDRFANSRGMRPQKVVLEGLGFALSDVCGCQRTEPGGDAVDDLVGVHRLVYHASRRSELRVEVIGGGSVGLPECDGDHLLGCERAPVDYDGLHGEKRYLLSMATTQKIRYSDCDPQAIVFNGNYARYWDDALTDWLEEAGYGGEELGGAGVDIVTARLEMDFRASARLGDVIETSIEVERFGNTSMTLGITTRRLSDGTIVTEGKSIHVFVDPESFRPTAVPDEVKQSLGGNPGANNPVQ